MSQQPIPAQSPEAPGDVPLNEDGRVDAEVCCMDCGYILRMMRVEDQCPECGRSVAESLRSGPLRMASPQWLMGLSAGLGWMVVYLVVWVICLISLIPLGMATSSGWVWLVLFIPAVIYLVGIWKLSARDPSRDVSQQPRRTARLAWILPALATLTTGLMLVFAMGYFLSAGGQPGWAGSLWSLLGLFVTRGLLHAAGFAAMLAYMVYIARRIPSNALAGQCKFLAWAIAITGVVLAGSTVAGAVGVSMMVNMTRQQKTSVQPPPSGPTNPQAGPGSPSSSGPTPAPNTTPTPTQPPATPPAQSASPTTSGGASGGVPVGANPVAPVGGPPPTPPTGQPDSTQSLGANPSTTTIKTWNTSHNDGSSTTYERQVNSNSDDLITITQTAANGSTTATVYVVDGNNTVTHKNTSATGAWAAGGASGIVYGILMVGAWFGQLGGYIGWLTFGIWAFVLVFVFRKHVRQALGMRQT